MRTNLARSLVLLLVFTILLTGLYSTLSGTVHAQTAGEPVVGAAVTPQTSPALRDLPVLQGGQISAAAATEINPRLITGQELLPTSPTQVDTALQPPTVGAAAVAPAPVASFDGPGATELNASYLPPDVSGDVGPDHYVQMINSVITIYNKQGTRLVGPTPINDLWRSQDNPCGRLNDGDPIVLYDQLADRWLVSQFAINEAPIYYECIAISQTPDPTGAFFLYAFNVGKEFPDYPKFGIWPDAYYMTTNSNPFGAFAFDRQKMLQGQAGTFQKFGANVNFMLPADLDGATAPPAGSPDFFYTTNNQNQYKLWAFHVDFADPVNSTFTPLPDLIAATYNYTSGIIIPQKGTPQLLDSIAEWPMWRFVYRNFGTHETLLGNFSVDADGNGHIGIRWFELRKTGNGPWQIYQEGTYAPDANHRWMGSIAMDGLGNIGLGYTASGADLFPSLRYTVRAAGDPLGQLQDEQTLVSGLSSQAGDRWGDYSSMSIDPTDDATFWYTGEFLDNTGNWDTKIGAFRLAATVSNPTLAITKTVVTANSPVKRGDPITYTVTVANTGIADAADVRVQDVLPAHVVGSNLDTTMTITAGEAVVFQVPAVLDTTAPYDTDIINTATFSHTSGIGQSSASIHVEPAPVSDRANLISSFTLNPSMPRANEAMTVTLLVTNTGTIQADNFYVDFYINPDHEPITATDWIELSSDPFYQGLEWEVDTLDAGRTITLTSSGNIGQAPDPAFTLWDGYLPAGASDLYSYADSFGYGDPNGMVSESDEQDNSYLRLLTPLTPTLDITLDAPESVPVGEEFDYTLTVVNSSDLTFENAVLSDHIPPGTQFVAASDGGTQANGVVTWQIDQMDPGETLVRLLTVVVPQYYGLSDSAQVEQVQSSVVGGDPSPGGAWPWQAAIIDNSAPDDFTGQYCGGTLIAADWVLTAASCVDGYTPSELAVVVGRQQLSSNTGQRLGVSQIVIHPDYDVIQKGMANEATFIDLNDVALVRLATPADLNALVAPIALATPADSSLVISGTYAIVTGWGNRDGGNDGSDFPDALQEADLPIVSNEACQAAYGDKFTVTDGMLCAGIPEGGIDSSAGDEGGPLMVDAGIFDYRQVGIVSFKYGRGCGKPGQYGVYTRVPQYTSWIESAMNTIANETYQITADNFRATGEFILETSVEPLNTYYLPYTRK